MEAGRRGGSEGRMAHVVIVGGGQAGASTAAKLREAGFPGAVTLLCAEPHAPYQRPPLSKAYLLGDLPAERLLLRPESFYAERSIELALGERATALDPAERRVRTERRTLAYDHLVLATGSRARRLPASIGGDLEGVHTVRDLAGIDAMSPRFAAGARVVIVGGGYIGLEAAAVAAKKGLVVTLIEAAPRILARVAAPETSDYFRALHASHGVRVLEGTALERLEGEGRVEAARLADGTRLPADFVIVGIGIEPDTELAEGAGLALDNGIAVDARGRSSAPDVWAAGDCASFPWRGGRIRLESVPHAIEQAETVARNIAAETTGGGGVEYDARPWFWSDQYDVKLQIAGLNAGYEHTLVRPGEREGTQSVWYYRGDRLLAVDAMNDARAYMTAKRLIEAGRSADPARVADPAVPLKDLLGEAA